jgi:transcriptional regulator with XRE-family HTH domain
VARLQSYADRAEQAWFRVRDPGLELLLRLGGDLSQEQIADFIAVMAKKQSKYERKYLDRDDEEVVEDAFESLEETLEDYLGRLDESQLQRLRVAAGALLRSDAIWLRERSAWTAELAEALQRKAGWQQRVRGIVRDWEARLDPDVQAVYDHNTNVVQAAIVDVVNSRSDKQDSRLRKKIDGFRDDLVLLISQQKN